MSGDGSYAEALEGRLDAGDRRFALVAARFHAPVTDRLLEAARTCLAEHGAAADQIEVIRVPGAWELPAAVRAVAATETVDAVVALGCVIQGETPHFDYICQEVARGLGAAGRATGIPVIFGVLTTLDESQARARAGIPPEGGAGSDDGLRSSKGWEAALAAMEMADVMEAVGEMRRPPGRSAPGFASGRRGEGA